MGPARVNNPAEYDEIVSNLRANGVEIRYSTNEFAYGPTSLGGRPGNIVFDPDASISAIRHEHGHFLDDQALGFPKFNDSDPIDPESICLFHRYSNDCISNSGGIILNCIFGGQYFIEEQLCIVSPELQNGAKGYSVGSGR
jgi:hypothetical protein